MPGFDPVNLGSAANARDGDTWRGGGEKFNAMLQELFGIVDTIGVTFISQESDFPAQDTTTITLEADTAYIITANFSTAKNFIWKNGSSWTSSSIDGPRVTFSGTGTMFTGVNESFYMHNASIDPGIGNEAFALTDNTTHTSKLLIETVQVENCLRWGTFEGAQIIEVTNSNSPNALNGCVFVGTNGVLFSFSKFALTSTSVTFKGIDLGSATATILEFSNLFFVAPAGAYGISGLASNGNVPSGRLGMVNNSEFLGGMTDLENITVDDTRWNFRDNSPTQDTFADAMLSLNGNATETVITASGTPVLVAGTWVIERASHFTGTSGGRVTYNGERNVVLPVDVTTTVSSASGTNKDIKIYLALNGSIITNSGKSNKVGAGDQKNTGVLWQLEMTEGDYLEVWVENNTDTVNLVVEDAIIRVR